MRNKKRAGFTLVEIMIVLAILVLLLTMVGPKLFKFSDAADQKVALTQIMNFKKTLELYKASTRTFPSTEEGLAALVTKPQDEQRAQNWNGPYIDEIPNDPWGNAFRYEYPPTKGNVKDIPNIWSAGPDGQDDTEDDIVSWKGGETGEDGGSQDGNAQGNTPVASNP